MPATSISISCNGVKGQTLQALSDLIQKRSQVLHETTEKSCIAIAIQTLKSLRAATVMSKGKIKPLVETAQSDLDIAIKHVPEYVVGFMTKNKQAKPCIRHFSKHGAIVNIKPWWKVNVNAELYDAKVFRVTLSSVRRQAWKKSKAVWYMVATDLQKAKKFVEQRYSKLVKRYSGLGKNAMSRAMALVSDRPAKITSDAKTYPVLAKNVTVSKQLSKSFTGSSGQFSITVEDNLRFAGNALKGGAGYVNTAMMKACNSVNGYINNFIRNNKSSSWFSKENWAAAEAPFPKEAFQD